MCQTLWPQFKWARVFCRDLDKEKRLRERQHAKRVRMTTAKPEFTTLQNSKLKPVQMCWDCRRGRKGLTTAGQTAWTERGCARQNAIYPQADLIGSIDSTSNGIERFLNHSHSSSGKGSQYAIPYTWQLTRDTEKRLESPDDWCFDVKTAWEHEASK